MIEVICGPMFSGKSEELIRRLTRAKIAGKTVKAFKPRIDDRYSTNEIASLSGGRFEAHDADLFELKLFEDVSVIGIDEVQFMSEELIDNVVFLADKGTHVLLAGLDMTYRREPFGPMPHLLAIADRVTKLSAVCHKCGEDAVFTQRLLDGRPAPLDAPTVQVGSLDTYEARCRSCFEVA